MLYNYQHLFGRRDLLMGRPIIAPNAENLRGIGSFHQPLEAQCTAVFPPDIKEARLGELLNILTCVDVFYQHIKAYLPWELS
jgi:hypothetical protein